MQSICERPRDQIQHEMGAWCDLMDRLVERLPPPTKVPAPVRFFAANKNGTDAIRPQKGQHVENYGALAITRPATYTEGGRMQLKGNAQRRIVIQTTTGLAMFGGARSVQDARRALAAGAALLPETLCATSSDEGRRLLDAHSHGPAWHAHIAYLTEPAPPEGPRTFPPVPKQSEISAPAEALRRCDPNRRIGSQIAIEGIHPRRSR